jgi:hypothetical protein
MRSPGHRGKSIKLIKRAVVRVLHQFEVPPLQRRGSHRLKSARALPDARRKP